MSLDCHVPAGFAAIFYDKANAETLNLGATLPNEQPIASYSKIVGYRLVSIATGYVEIITSLSKMILMASATLITLGKAAKPRQWFILSKKTAYHTLMITIKNIQEVYYVAIAALRGYKKSAIFSSSLLSHLNDGQRMERLHQLQVPSLGFTSGSNQIKIHKEFIEGSSSDYLKHLFTNGMQEQQTGIANSDLSQKALFALRRFIYTGFTSLEPQVNVDLLKEANMMGFPELEQHCTRRLIPYLSEYLSSFLPLSAEINSSYLKEACFEYMQSHPSAQSLTMLRQLNLSNEYAAFLNRPTVEKESDELTRDSVCQLNLDLIKDKNVSIQASNGKVQTSRLILAAYCPSLYNRLRGETISIEMPKVSTGTVNDLLNFIYKNKLPEVGFHLTALERWTNLFKAVNVLNEYELWFPIKIRFEAQVQQAFRKQESFGNHLMSIIEDLQQIGHELHSSPIVNLCMQTRVINYLKKIKMKTKLDHSQTQRQLFNEYAYHLNELKLDLTNLSPYESRIENILDGLLENISQKCPLIKNLMITVRSDYFSKMKEKIAQHGLYEKCPSLRSITLD